MRKTFVQLDRRPRRTSRPVLFLTIASALVATPPADALAQVGGRAAKERARTAPRSQVAGSDTLRLYYVGYPVGHERWTLSAGGDGTRRFTTELDYVDRGRRTHLRTEATLAPDWTPRTLSTTRLTDTTSTVESRVVLAGSRAIVDYRSRHDTVVVQGRPFAITGATPVAQHFPLVRHWLAKGRPAVVKVIPGAPTNDVQVAWRGRDTVQVLARTTILDRYAVNGVVWGQESVWLDGNGLLAAFSTAGGGGLTMEAVRLSLDEALPQLRRSATRDRMRELVALSRTVHPVARGTIALIGATLIDGTGRDAIPHAVVVVSDGRIAAVGAHDQVTIPPNAKRIDLTGRTIMPGLWDMHTHLMQMEWGPVYLAAGVTSARDMGNVVDFIVPFRATVDSGLALGPRMPLAGLVDGGGPNAFGAENATTPEEGRAVVRKYRALGFEQVKLYSLLTPAVVRAIADEAHRLGMTVTGHVPTALTVAAAVDSGMDHIAHLPIRGDASSDSVQRLIAHLRERGTVIDPTASWGELLQHSTAEPLANFQPGIAKLPPVLAQRIAAMGIATVDSATAHARLARTLSIIGALHAAGVPVIAGTDEGVPGFSVYREIELYVAAGFTPMEALRAATAVSAKAMGMEDRLGTLETGKLADLVVLDANPLERIANVRRVSLVMKGGTLWRSADIWRAVGFR
ncbi:MAG: amidohydrolase family protein [Gemmatimonadaceae bacterium]|nr:amidohydrolase family protein [Gemmatimonadaceae bacterium]